MSKKVVLVQAGHVLPRQPGFESGTGTAGEIALVHEIEHKLITLLEEDMRFHPLHFHGDLRNAPKDGSIDAALFLHADGAANETASGYSFGYPDYKVNEKLANLVGDEFQKIPGHPPHHADNYTRDLQGYYGFRWTETPGPEVVVEHGFLTNPGERRWLVAHTGELAVAEHIALQRFFNMKVKERYDPAPAPHEDVPWPVPLPTWFWVWARWYLGRGEYATCGPHNNVSRPANAPLPIPDWAWSRLHLLVEGS